MPSRHEMALAAKATAAVTGKLADSTSNGCISGNNSTITSGSNATRNGAGGAGDSGGNGNSGGSDTGIITSGGNAKNGGSPWRR